MKTEIEFPIERAWTWAWLVFVIVVESYHFGLFKISQPRFVIRDVKIS